MKPIIGVVEWPYLDKDGDLIYEIKNEIIEWIQRSGGRPMGIFPTQIENFVNTRLRDLPEMTMDEKKDLKETLEICSAIIKPGATKIYSHDRYIYDYCLDKNMPYIGICAGMQTMANSGNTQVENIKNNGFVNHCSDDTYIHDILLKKNTKLQSLLGKDEIKVNSHHNYHIKYPGIHNIAAYSEDLVIEAIENSRADFHFGLQWHPELLPKEDENSQILFGEFVEAARTYKKRTYYVSTK